MLMPSQKIEMLKSMMMIRHFEHEIKVLYKQGDITGAIHCYTGEEAVAVGACSALRQDDYIFSTHRGHGHALAKGCQLNRVLAELMGRSTGLCGGMGGSMHLFDIENGLMGENGIVGGGLPLSLGTAYSTRYRGTDKVTVCFFSDGASNQGTFGESLNMAALWKLPLIFICENNQFAATTPSQKFLAHPDIADRAAGYGIQGVIADGNDVLDVYEKTGSAIDKARSGKGPTLLECKTYRVEGHCMALRDLDAHRPEEAVRYWAERDPVSCFKKRLLKECLISQDIIKQIMKEIEIEFAEAYQYAKESAFPSAAGFMSRVESRYE